MIVSDDRSAVQIYATEGNLKSTMNVPDGHDAFPVAFHHGMCKIIVLTYVEKCDSYFILSFSETGELENSVLFCKKDYERNYVDKKSHPSGQVIVAVNETITFI